MKTAKLSTKKLPSSRKARGCGRAEGDHTPDSGLVLYHTKGEKAQPKALLRKKQIKSSTNLLKTYKQKLIKYGNSIDLITYHEQQFTHAPTRTDFTKTNSKQRRQDSLWRTRNTVCRIINANVDENPLFHPVFLTLTFGKDIQDPKIANRLFKDFIKRFNYNFKLKLKYIAVLEFQPTSKRVHYHMVLFNMPFIPGKKIESVWKHGSTETRLVRNIKDVSKYVGKYMSKELIDDRLIGQKAFFTSRGLSRPQEFYEQHNIDLLLQNANLKRTLVRETSKYKFEKFKI